MIAKRLLAIQKASSPPAPAATDVYYDYRSLILNMQGSAGSTTFTDSSPNNFTVTPYGNAQLATVPGESVAFLTAASFDGSGDYLQTNAASCFAGTQDFTVEFWLYWDAVPTADTAIIGALGSGGSSIGIFNYNTDFGILKTGGGTFANFGSKSQLTAGQWNHVAVTRSGSSHRCFINGMLSSSGVVTSSADWGTPTTCWIGRQGHATIHNYLAGKLGPVRISPWAVYKSNFTPTQDLFPAAPDSIYANPYYDKVALQLKFDGTNGSTSFVDTGPNAFAVTPSGNAQITSASKYGSGAGAFDGSGDYLQVSNNALYNFGSSNFTIEGWIYPVTSSGERVIVAKNEGSYTTGYEWWLGILGSNNLQFTFVNASATFYSVTSSTTIPANTWTHVSVVRSGSTITLFVNGVISGTTTSQTIRATASNVSVSRDLENLGGGRYFNGSIDELEITPGVAKYKANFTPPVRGLSTIYNPYTTLPVSGAALWLDGADSSTLFTDAGVTPVAKSGDLIYQWSDKSGNNRHATQATSANRPTWVPPATGQNGLGAVGFNGSTQWINFSSLSLTSFTAFVVFQQSDLTYGSVLIGNGLSGSAGWPNYLAATTGTIININNVQATDPRTNGTQWEYGVYKLDGSAGTVTAYSAGSTGSTASGSPGTATFASIGYYSTTQYITYGKVAEIIIYPTALTDSNRMSVNNYIKAKWGF